jgi:cytochrome oxidase Cu insertion factor (SCO1/SenC/PrrC family)
MLSLSEPFAWRLSPDESLVDSAAASRVLTFRDHTGRAVSESDFAGSFQLVFFGYTECPDVCPSNLVVMGEALRVLGEDADRVQPIFVTLDPERDGPGTLAEYVTHFHPRLVGLTGDSAQIAAAATAYGVYVERVEAGPGAEAGSYSLSHTAQTYLIGPDGEGLAIFEHGSDPRAMAAEILERIEAGPDPRLGSDRP